jgi:hypothetical protein
VRIEAICHMHRPGQKTSVRPQHSTAGPGWLAHQHQPHTAHAAGPWCCV